MCYTVVTMVMKTDHTSICRQIMEISGMKASPGGPGAPAPGAPLARMESYDDEEYDDGVIRVTVTFDDDEPETIGPIEQQQQQQQPIASEIRKKSSPSLRLRASVLRKRVTKKRPKTTEVDAASNDGVHHNNDFMNVTSGTLSDSSSKSPVLGKRDSGSDVTRIQHVIEHVIDYIEEHGLSTEGLYRKSGTQSKVKKLHRKLQKASSAKDNSSVDLAAYGSDIHVLTSALKSLLRELKEPIIPRDLHSYFMKAVELLQEQEREHALEDLIHRLPTANRELFERLISHLMRVANQRDSNRMSVEALAIIFAPNIMSSHQGEQPTIQSVASTICFEKQQARCLQYIIESRMKKSSSSNIDEFDEYSTTTEVNDVTSHVTHIGLHTDQRLQGSPVSSTSDYMSTDWSWSVKLEERPDWSWSVKMEEQPAEPDKQSTIDGVSRGGSPTTTELPLVRTIADYLTVNDAAS